MTWRLAIRLGLVLGVLIASPGMSEIYRWTDAQGREHFTTNLQQVPPGQRDGARKAAERSDDRINHYTAPSTRRAPPAKKARPSSEPGEPAASPARCEQVRRQARALLKNVRYHQKKLETHERRADDIGRSVYSRRRHEARGERAAEWLEKAQAAYDRFEREQRRQGIEPGCLRP